MGIEIPFRREFKHVKRNTDMVRRVEQRNGPDNVWHVFGSTIFDYEDAFNDVLPGKGRFLLMEMLSERQRAGKTNIVLDMMSDGTAISQMKPDAGLAVTLTDPRISPTEPSFYGGQHKRPDQNMPVYGEGGIDLVTGDIFDKATWQKVQEWLETIPQTDKSFSLIIVHALGGLRDMPANPEFHLFLLQRLWDTLSTDNGTLLVTVPNEVRNAMPSWCQALTSAGIDHAYKPTETIGDSIITTAFPPLRLTKTEHSPKQLPSLT